MEKNEIQPFNCAHRGKFIVHPGTNDHRKQTTEEEVPEKIQGILSKKWATMETPNSVRKL